MMRQSVTMVSLPSEIVQIFSKLGFPDPEPIPLMPLKYQVAQKLHGLTAKDSDRVRDVIDLQLIARAGIDLSAVRMSMRSAGSRRRENADINQSAAMRGSAVSVRS